MSEQARGREVGDQAGATLYEQYRWEIRRASARRADGPHSREYDANGFPVPQRNTSFVVARLRNAL